MSNVRDLVFEKYKNSVGDVWRQAASKAAQPWEMIDYCSDESLEEKANPNEDYLSVYTESNCRIGLELKLLDLSDHYADQYLQNSIQLGPKAIAKGYVPFRYPYEADPVRPCAKEFEPMWHLAMAQSALSLKAPDRSLLRESAQKMLQGIDDEKRLNNRPIDTVYKSEAMIAVLCAFLAHDLVLARELLSEGVRTFV